MKEMEINKPAIIARLKAYRERKGPDAYRILAHYVGKKSVSSYVLQSIANSAYRVPNDIWERIDKVLDELEKRLGIGVGETTADGMFTLNATRCIGCCGLAPAMMVNDEVYGRLVPGDVPGIIEKYRARG